MPIIYFYLAAKVLDLGGFESSRLVSLDRSLEFPTWRRIDVRDWLSPKDAERDNERARSENAADVSSIPPNLTTKILHLEGFESSPHSCPDAQTSAAKAVKIIAASIMVIRPISVLRFCISEGLAQA